MSFHGAGANGDAQRAIDHFAELGDQEGFVTVYPNGESVDLGPFGVANLWSLGPKGGPIDEAAFVAHLLDVVGDGLCIDTRRVFATGISLGGGMARLVGCELADRLAAFAPVSPVTPRPCTTGTALPMIGFHGTADLILPYTGTATQQAAEAWAGEQAARNGCRPGSSVRQTIGAADRLGWRECDAATTFYRLNGAGHSWPGSPPPVPRDVLIALLTPVAPLFGLSPEQLADTFLNTNMDIDATHVIWSFFKAHPRQD
jgi:polyhydroxybutyrate depolymerase